MGSSEIPDIDRGLGTANKKIPQSQGWAHTREKHTEGKGQIGRKGKTTKRMGNEWFKLQLIPEETLLK